MKLRPALLSFLFIMAISALGFDACATKPPPVAKVDFAKQVRPIFEAYCYQCHGNGRNRAGFRIDQKALVMRQIVAGDPARSYLYRAMTKSLGASDHMPPMNEDQPEDSDLATIKLWIEQGAVWPEGA